MHQTGQNLRTRQLNQLVDSVRKEWGEAENLIREGEIVSDSIVFPAVNELRYAGTHLALGLEGIARNEDNARAAAELESALRHIRRSKADSREQLLSYIKLDTRRMMAQYGGPAITEFFPNFPSMTSKSNEVGELLANSGRFTKTEHQEYSRSTELNESVLELLSLHSRLMETESFLKPRSKTSDKRSYWTTVGGVLAALAGTLIAIFSGL